ncbi:hypothetical protein RJ640_018662 [Escallonia rubra]|uniref:Transcription initiation factor TFIID component TAF4 C-terminal domain-containing protein n=1 Tax=Escallonia rubra TaxID=112253 RepID=A0AA88QR84_9ASTE|nr:hypothetical protein RJ640_018662 [Escallonia rubra]
MCLPRAPSSSSLSILSPSVLILASSVWSLDDNFTSHEKYSPLAFLSSKRPTKHCTKYYSSNLIPSLTRTDLKGSKCCEAFLNRTFLPQLVILTNYTFFEQFRKSCIHILDKFVPMRPIFSLMAKSYGALSDLTIWMRGGVCSSKSAARIPDQSIEQLNDVTAVSGIDMMRVDFEKTRHQTIVTSNVQHQIVSLSRKGRDRVKQQAEEGATAIGDKDEDAPISERSQAEKVIRVQQTAAANVAARAAIGGEDVASKWRHMSRKAQSVPQSGKGPLGAENISPSIQFARPQHQAVHLISVQDVIAVLEREPQMSKSKFMHCLHERSNAKAVVANDMVVGVASNMEPGARIDESRVPALQDMVGIRESASQSM